MKSLETLYFPDTAIFTENQIPLFLFADKVHILAPVENISESVNKREDAFIDSRFCHIHTPHPLGEDRERFLYLINDLKNRKDDYAAQLRDVTLASMSEKQGSGDDSGHQIISSLLNSNPGEAKTDGEQQRERLWQARLVLKIGEMLDREEEEVARSLVALEETEADVLGLLKGENDEDDELADLSADLEKIKKKLDKPRLEVVGKRLRAWFRLADEASLPACRIWSTTRPEVVDILFTNHERRHDQEPEQIAMFQIPFVPLSHNESIEEAIKNFQQSTRNQLSLLVELLLEEKAEAYAEKEKADHELRKWEIILDEHFPLNQFGRTTVSIYCFQEPLARYSGLAEQTGKSVSPRLLALFNS